MWATYNEQIFNVTTNRQDIFNIWGDRFREECVSIIKEFEYISLITLKKSALLKSGDPVKLRAKQIIAKHSDEEEIIKQAAQTAHYKKTSFMGWKCCNYGTLYKRQSTLELKCIEWVEREYEWFKARFLKVSGFESLQDAIYSQPDIDIGCVCEALWYSLYKWIDGIRRAWMDKMQLEIQKKTGVSVPKVPQSHGGIANLLKILTKTMEKQGADIRNIAKVQYAVCVQAGVMIPEVFLTDVAAALDYKEAVEALE